MMYLYGCPTLILLLVLLTSLTATSFADDTLANLPTTLQPSSPPLLTGHHFKITAVEEEGFIDIQDNGNGDLSFSGYLIDILEELASRANFTYELRTPSGFGSRCLPRLVDNATLPAYHKRYRQDYRCGESDVNDRPLHYYSTDLYWGMYYVTPERLQVNQFSVPFSPPDRATLGMLGTATHIRDIQDLANFPDYKVCALEGTAYMESLQLSFPQLTIQGIAQDDNVYVVLEEGTCDIILDAYPMLKRNILNFYLQDKCLANGKPIGVIGEPLQYGLNHFAFGMRMDLDKKVVQTLNFWLQALMACFPDDPNGYCPNGQGSLSHLYDSHGGQGDECGYIQFPTDPIPESMSAGAIAAIAITPVVLVIVLGMLYHRHQLQQQEKRMKKRFIQQLARNIDIGPSAHQISAAKISEMYNHIGGQNGLISKQDLAKWLMDLNLDFLSERDFDRLFETMDMDGAGFVDPIEFCHFLNECEKQFQEVHSEFSALPKSEKRKLATRRLTNYKNFGTEEVEKMERRNKRRNRFVIMPKCKESPRSSNSSRSLQHESSSMTAGTDMDDSSKLQQHQPPRMSEESLLFRAPSDNNLGDRSPAPKAPFSESTLKRIEEDSC